jgi:hypothetical protein
LNFQSFEFSEFSGASPSLTYGVAVQVLRSPTLSQALLMGRMHMDTAMFYDDCAYLAQRPGPRIGDEEGRVIHEALGDKRAILAGSPWPTGRDLNDRGGGRPGGVH